MENSNFYISRAEHDEFCRRIDSENQRLSDEDNRQNKRLDSLEASVKELTDAVASLTSSTISSLANSTERLSDNMKSLMEVQKNHKERLVNLERKGGDLAWKILVFIAATVGGIVIGAIAFKLGVTVV